MDDLGKHLPSLGSPQQLTALSKDLSERKKLAAYHAKLILGCYRAGDASDPEIYVTAVAAVLARYAPEVGAQLSDPKDGIAGKLKWLPTISEIREEADKLLAADQAAARREKDLHEQWRLRDEQEQLNKEENAEYRRAVIARVWPERTTPREWAPFERYSNDRLREIYRKPETDHAEAAE